MDQPLAFQLSPQQRQLWASGAGGALPRAVALFQVGGDLAPRFLVRALRSLVDRHEILRTAFRVPPGLRVPVQIVGERCGLRVERPSLVGLGAERQSEELARILRQLAAPAPDGEEPELHAVVAPLGDRRWAVFLALPALAADAVTLGNLAGELAAAYAAALRDETPAAAEVQYVQFSEWQNAVARDLAGGGGALPDPALLGARARLPYERPAAGHADPAEPVAQEARRLGALETARLQAFASARGASPAAVLLAAWQLLLWRLTSGNATAVSVVLAGRAPAELRAALGRFASAAPAPAAASGALRFVDLVARAHAFYEDAEAGYGALWASRGGEPDEALLPIGFEHRPAEAVCVAAGVSWRLAGLAAPAVPFRLHLVCTSGPAETGLELAFLPALLARPAAGRLLEQLRDALDAALRQPEETIERLSWGEAERQELVEEFNATAVERPALGAHQLFERRADLAPDLPAVAWTGGGFSCAGLEARANRLAWRLWALGLQPEERVAVLLDRSPDLLPALLATLKAGGCYVPLDPQAPEERLRFLLEDSRPAAVLTSGRLAPRLDGLAVPRVLVDAADLEEEPDRRLPLAVLPDQAAYVIYTSGSTGRPKGVVVSHRALVNYLLWCVETYPAGDGLAAPLHSSVSFDLTVTSLLAPLAAGGRVDLLPEGDDAGRTLAEALRSGAFGLVKLTPSHLSALAGLLRPAEIAGKARALVLGGEALLAESARFWRAGDPRTRLINEYGPTEATVGCCVHEVPAGAEPQGVVPIGRPIANARMYAVDGELRPVPMGVTGEIFIGGDGLARGYLGRPDLTAERFVPDPLSGRPGERLYRTGDLARHLPEAGLEYLGRNDDQIKIRGLRIEPAEVEAALLEHPAVREAAAGPWEIAPGQLRLAAWLVPAGSALPPDAEIRAFLESRLPAAMVPSVFLALPALPRAASGKVDRRALPSPAEAQAAAARPFVAPRTEAERALGAIWAEVLRAERIGADDSFFALGGDSILSTQVVFKASQAGYRITTRQMFQHPTLAELAAHAERAQAAAAAEEPPAGPVPLTPIQRWFFELGLPNPHRWNQALWLECRRTPDREALTRAARRLLEHHAALRLRFRREPGEWRQEVAEAPGEVAWSVVDLSSSPSGADAESAAAARAAAVQDEIDLAAGPLLRLVLFELGEGRPARLLVTLHHLVVDGVSWRILLEDLFAAYAAELEGRAVELPRTASYARWASRLAEHARSPRLRDEAGFWLAQGAPAPRLPRDREDGTAVEASVRSVVLQLEPEETRALLQDAHAAYRTRIEDLLLTALVETVGRWSGGSAVRVLLEGHGREPLFDDLDTSRTVGWFTTLYPAVLDSGPRREPGERIKAVKEQLRRIPGKGIGYGLLRHLSDDESLRARLAALPQPEIGFNYLGQWNAALPEGFALRNDPVEGTRDPAGRRSLPLSVTAGVVDGRFQVSWAYSENLHERSTIEHLATTWVSELRDLIAHCSAPDAGGATPSDFPEAGLGQEALDRFLAELMESGR